MWFEIINKEILVWHALIFVKFKKFVLLLKYEKIGFKKLREQLSDEMSFRFLIPVKNTFIHLTHIYMTVS